ncbi:MAG: hypothetical protein VYE22_03050 [Myxococcota bacterium]|nr:hypothetical protein [Myxococcota bacterium]
MATRCPAEAAATITPPARVGADGALEGLGVEGLNGADEVVDDLLASDLPLLDDHVRTEILLHPTPVRLAQLRVVDVEGQRLGALDAADLAALASEIERGLGPNAEGLEARSLEQEASVLRVGPLGVEDQLTKATPGTEALDHASVERTRRRPTQLKRVEHVEQVGHELGRARAAPRVYDRDSETLHGVDDLGRERRDGSRGQLGDHTEAPGTKRLEQPRDAGARQTMPSLEAQALDFASLTRRRGLVDVRITEPVADAEPNSGVPGIHIPGSVDHRVATLSVQDPVRRGVDVHDAGLPPVSAQLKLARLEAHETEA